MSKLPDNIKIENAELVENGIKLKLNFDKFVSDLVNCDHYFKLIDEYSKQMTFETPSFSGTKAEIRKQLNDWLDKENDIYIEKYYKCHKCNYSFNRSFF